MWIRRLELQSLLDGSLRPRSIVVQHARSRQAPIRNDAPREQLEHVLIVRRRHLRLLAQHVHIAQPQPDPVVRVVFAQRGAEGGVRGSGVAALQALHPVQIVAVGAVRVARARGAQDGERVLLASKKTQIALHERGLCIKRAKQRPRLAPARSAGGWRRESAAPSPPSARRERC